MAPSPSEDLPPSPASSPGRKAAQSPSRVSALAAPLSSSVTRSQSRRLQDLEQRQNEPTVDLPLQPPQSPSLVPSSVYFDTDSSGRSALERYRQRKNRQSWSLTPRRNFNAGTPARGREPPPLPPSHSSFSLAEEEETTIGYASCNFGTPGRRGKSRRSSAISLGGAQRLTPFYPASRERLNERSDEEPREQHHRLPAEREVVVEQQQPQTPAFSKDSVESVDGAAMKSRLQAMQKRNESLERENMELSMSKASLEARIRQKDDASVKERERLCAEIEAHQASSKEVDERCRELEMKNQVLTEENSRLRLEARAVTSNAAAAGMAGGGSGAKDWWLKNMNEEIKSLRIEKVSLESEVYGHQQEIETMERNYNKLEKDYQELYSSNHQNSEAEIQLQVLTTKHAAMTAQLNATIADLEEIKTRAAADLQAKEDEANIQLQVLTTKHTAVTARLNATIADLEEIKTRAAADLQAKEDGWKARESELLLEMSVLKSHPGNISNQDVTLDSGEGDEDPTILKARIEENSRRISELEEQHDRRISELEEQHDRRTSELEEQHDRRLSKLEEQLAGGEQLRRALCNLYVHTRPFLPSDGAARHSSICILPDGESLSIQGKYARENHGFKFDKVFAPSSGRNGVFNAADGACWWGDGVSTSLRERALVPRVPTSAHIESSQRGGGKRRGPVSRVVVVVFVFVVLTFFATVSTVGSK